MDTRPIGNIAQPSPMSTETSAVAITAKQIGTSVQTVAAIRQAPQIPTLDQVAQAVKEINESVKSQGLEFSIDTDSQQTVVKVVDQKTQEIIRQMPSVEALEIAKALDRLQGLLIKQQA